MKYLTRLLPLICVTLISQFSFAQLPYSEDFTGQNGKGVAGVVGSPASYDTSSVDWTISADTTGFDDTSDYFKVNTVSSNEIFEARDVSNEVVWFSPVIDIMGEGLVDLSVDISEVGTLEASDYINVYYILNGSGTEVLFSTNGENYDDFSSAVASENALSGSSVQIVIRIDNNADTEKHRFENVSISAATGYNTPSAGDVLITEYAKNGTKTHSYVELYNTTSNPIDLSDCKIVSSGSNNGVYDFSTDIPGYAYIPANGFLVLNSDAAQTNYESQWGVTISATDIYTRTGLTIFKNNNTFKLKQGGTEGVDDGTLIDETTEYPADGNRVYQLPVGYWTNNEDENTNATPGFLGTNEDIDNIKLVYADGAWQAATGYAHSSPSSSTGSAEAIVLRGQATFANGSVLDKLSILSEAGTSITTESVSVTSELFIADDASLAITGSGSVTCSGSITFQREGHNLTSDYNVWGSPFSSNTSIASVFTNHYNCEFYAFEASSQSWKYDETVGGNLNCSGNNYTVSTAMALSTTNSEGNPDGNFDVGRGYFIVGNPDNVISFTHASGGVLNNGDISVQIFGSSNVPSDGSNDWNLISNPYPSAVSVADFLTENSGTGKLSNAVYIYNPGNSLNTITSYDTYDKTMTSEYIAGGQGFYVDGNTTTDGLAYSITFENSMRHHTDTDFRSVLTYSGVFLDVKDENGENDPTRIYFDDQSLDEFDPNFDALKLPNGDFNFCSKVGDKKLVFNGYSELTNENRVIPLYFQTNQSSVYTIEMDSLVGQFENKDVLLEDRLMRSFHNLKQNGYSFSSAPKEWANRFYLHVVTRKSNDSSNNSGSGSTDSTGTVSGIDEINEELFKVFVANEELVVSLLSNDDQVSRVEIITATGYDVASKNVKDNVAKFDISSFSKGIYFVRTQLSNGEIKVRQVIIP